MKVVFICGSLEEGKDGVGDYTKRLSIECEIYNISPIIIAINDKYISEDQKGFYDDVPFYRIPEALSLDQKEKKIECILNENSPIEWISLQFVSYAFNKNGIIKSYISLFNRLFNGYKVHIMMHELWLGEERNASLKIKLLGIIQKQYILQLLKKIKPAIVQTSIPIYKLMLNNSGINASILPIFSNINYQQVTVNDNYKLKIPERILNNKNNYIVGCVFGSIYFNSWDMSSMFDYLQIKSKSENKRILIVSIGKISYGQGFWEKLPLIYPDFEFLTLGQQEESFISNFFIDFIDFGIITTPAIIAGKSGTCMAFIEHGVPIYCKKNELSFNFDISDILIDKTLIQINSSFIEDLPTKKAPVSLIRGTTLSFAKKIKDFK